MAQNGTDVLILVDTGGGSFAALGSQTNASISETTSVIDASSKDARERAVEAGRYEATYSFESLFVPSDAQFQALRSAMRNGTKVNLREQQDGWDTEEVSAVVTSMTRDYPDQDSSTISLEAAVDGAITDISAT